MAGNTANQFISKGVSNYDVVEAVASSTATAASFMGMGFMSGAASSAGNKAAQKVAGIAMKKAAQKWLARQEPLF